MTTKKIRHQLQTAPIIFDRTTSAFCVSGDDRLMLVRQRTLWSADRAIGLKLGERAGDALWRSARLSARGEGWFASLALACGRGMLPYSFPKFQGGIIAPPVSSLSFSRNPNGASHKGSHEAPTIALALALLAPVSARAATIIIKHRHDRHRRRGGIRIVQIDTCINTCIAAAG